MSLEEHKPSVTHVRYGDYRLLMGPLRIDQQMEGDVITVTLRQRIKVLSPGEGYDLSQLVIPGDASDRPTLPGTPGLLEPPADDPTL